MDESHVPTSPDEATSERKPWLSPGVLGVGGASMFSDAGHEMATSLLPAFVIGTLGGGPAALGAIAGVADAFIGLSKLAGGPLAADPRRRRWLASGGYLGTAVATAAIGLTTAVWQVGLLRGLAWVSRGVRSPARDMLLTDLTEPRTYGRAFGVERAGDNIGAVIGPLMAAALVGSLGVRSTILLAIVPGALAAVAIAVAAREAGRNLGRVEGQRTLSLNLAALRRAGIVRILAPVACFEFGNLAATLVILRATGVLAVDLAWSPTRAASVAMMLYAGHNAVAAGAALIGGALSDRRNPRFTFSLGVASYLCAYVAFAVGGSLLMLLVGFALAGAGIGLVETAESTVVATRLPGELRSNAFGLLGLTQSMGDIAATVVAGLLWSAFSAEVAFTYAAAWMVVSLVSSRILRPRLTAGLAGQDPTHE